MPAEIDDFDDDLDEMLAEFCAEVTDLLNGLARDLHVPSRVWYVTALNGKVIVLRFDDARAQRFFGGTRRTAPNKPAWPW